MNTALWICAAVLATLFLAAGIGKLTVPREKLASAPGGGWAGEASPRFIKTLGVLEVAAAVGLILPAVTGVVPVLVPLAGLGIVIIMVGAAIVHARRREVIGVAANLTYLALAAFVAWGRFGPESFTS